MARVTAILLTALLAAGSVTAAGGTVPDRPVQWHAPYAGDLFHGQFRPPAPPTVHQPDDSLLEAFIRDGRMRLRLEDVIALAVHNNLSIQLERYTVQDSAMGFYQSRSPFEATWQNSFGYSRDTTPAASIFQGVGSAVNKDTAYTTRLAKYFETGTTLSADLSLRKNWTNSEFYIVNPNYAADWTLGVTQHLLRGFGREANLAPVFIAENTLRISEFDFQARLERTLLEAIALYLDILDAELDLEVRRESVRLAEKTRDDVALQVEAGTEPELDLYKARAAVASRSKEQTESETRVRNLKQTLLTYLSPGRDPWRGGDFDLELERLDPNVAETPIPFDRALELAMANRPEIRAALAGVTIRDIEQRLARHNLRPALDVTAAYTQHGLKGQIGDLSELPFPVPPGAEAQLRETFSGATWDAFTSSFDGKYNGFSVQVSVDIPIGNLDARAAAQRAAIALEKEKTSLDALRQQIALELRTAYNNIERDRSAIQSAREARIEAEKNLEGEQARYDAGVVVIRDLLEAQRVLTTARSEENQALFRYRLSILRYYRASAQLLDKTRIAPVAALTGEPLTRE